MTPALAFALFSVAAVALAVFYLFFYRNWRRQRELKRPFPRAWRKLLKSQVPLYRRLPAPLKRELEQRVQLFLSEKNFYGCDGFEVDDRVRLTIAGHACLLVLARSYSDYDEVRSILVYPGAYYVSEPRQNGMVVDMEQQVRAGEASSFGQVVLSWDDCEHAVRAPNSDHNVILHEFAHQLDYLDGSADGAPPLSGEQARRWQKTMSEAYGQLQQSIEQHQESWLDPYGATEPAEFFAVLTETFYQQPGYLKEQQPGVYRALCDFYRLDPLEYR
ncbi:zinc-dependent peptidase [Marinobacter sp.]|uniref:M90 family metallopeptidase n=1 Tax=Marinobacter sp. TaxID=50741 RepID=UPI0035614ACA